MGVLKLKIILRVLKQEAISSLPTGSRRWGECDGPHTANSLTSTTTPHHQHHHHPSVSSFLFLSTPLPHSRLAHTLRREIEITLPVMPVSLQNATPNRRTLSQNRTRHLSRFSSVQGGPASCWPPPLVHRAEFYVYTHSHFAGRTKNHRNYDTTREQLHIAFLY